MGPEQPAIQPEKAALAKENVAPAAQSTPANHGLELIVADQWMCSVALGILIHDTWSAIVGKIRRRREIARLESWLALPS